MKVLIVHDDSVVSARLRRVLDVLGHKVVATTGSSIGGMTAAAHHAPDLTLVAPLLADGETGEMLAWELHCRYRAVVAVVSAGPTFPASAAGFPELRIVRPFCPAAVATVVARAERLADGMTRVAAERPRRSAGGFRAGRAAAIPLQGGLPPVSRQQASGAGPVPRPSLR